MGCLLTLHSEGYYILEIPLLRNYLTALRSQPAKFALRLNETGVNMADEIREEEESDFRGNDGDFEFPPHKNRGLVVLNYLYL